MQIIRIGNTIINTDAICEVFTEKMDRKDQVTHVDIYTMSSQVFEASAGDGPECVTFKGKDGYLVWTYPEQVSVDVAQAVESREWLQTQT